jgi:hypothetical protein
MYLEEINNIINNNKWINNIELIKYQTIRESEIDDMDEEQYIYLLNLKFNNNEIILKTDFNYFYDIDNEKYENILAKIIFINHPSIYKIIQIIDNNICKNNSIENTYPDNYHIFNNIEKRTKVKLNFEAIKNISKSSMEKRKDNIYKIKIPKELLLNQQQIFLLLLNEIERINNNFDYNHYIYPYEDNIYDLRLRLFFNNSEKLDFLEFKLTINPTLYPFFPPKLEVVYPKLKLELLFALLNLNIFKIENWNSSITLDWIIQNIHKLLEPIIYDYIDNNNEFTDIELLLLKLAHLTKDFSTNKLELKIDIPKIKEISNDESNKYWKAGTGYGFENTSSWDIKNYIKEKELFYNEITKILGNINILINKENIDIICNSCLCKYITNTINDVNLLSIQDSRLLFVHIVEILHSLYEYHTELSLDFKDNINKNFTNINEEVITLFKNNEESQMDELFHSICNIYEKYNKLVDIKTNNETVINDDCKIDYENFMKTNQFDTFEINSSHLYYSEIKNKLDSKTLLRVISEVSSFKKGLPVNWESSIWLRISKSNMNIFSFIISGPKDTPYEDGLFEFHAYMPNNYPNIEPKVLLKTTGNGTVRFNPNLYNTGKVCLSLLGTWNGNVAEKWIPENSTFLQVLVSIQSLILIEEPYYNEPGYERKMNTEVGNKESNNYNEIIQNATMEWAIIDCIKNPPNGFENIVKEHFKRKKDCILETYEKYVDKSVKLKSKMTETYKKLCETLSKL